MRLNLPVATCRYPAAILVSLLLVVACRSPSAPVDVVESTVTVMTYNIFHDAENQSAGVLPWDQRRDAVVSAIRGESPDLLGLQEAEEWQISWLLEQLPEYSAVARGVSANPQAVGAQTEGILYRTARFELRESGHFWYSDSPDEPGSYGTGGFGGLKEPRMATWVGLILLSSSGDDSRGVYLFNTHFIADGRADDPDLARAQSAKLLVERIARRSQAGDFFFLTGDLNTEPGEWPLRYLLGSRCETPSCPGAEPEPEVRMVDAWASQRPGGAASGTQCNAVTGRDGRRIDYILAWDAAPSAGATVSRAEIVDPGSTCPSDHRAVVATFVLPPPGSP